MKDITLGERAYRNYHRAVGGTTYNDRPLPKWHELGERQREGWEAAARSVLQHLCQVVQEELQ